MKQRSLEAVLPLSPLQQGMLFHSLYDSEGVDFYNMQAPLELTGALDTAALKAACAAVLERHPSLRAGFLQRRSGEAVQAVAARVELDWAEADLSAFGATEQRARLGRLLAEDRERRFDMRRPPLVRFTLVRLGAERHLLVLTNHHILLDGWSLPIVVRDLFRGYAQGGDASGLEPVAPFSDYLGWLQAQDREEAERAWRDTLAGLTQPTLVAPGAGSDSGAGRQQRASADLDEAEASDITDAARRRGLTVNTLVQGAWALLLALLTGSDDVVFGATVAGRPPEVEGVEGMVGLLINTVPVRVLLDPATPVGTLLERVQEQQSALSGYQYLGLADIHRATGMTQLFDTTVAFENYPLDPALARGGLPGLGISLAQESVDDTPEGTHYPLSLAVYPGERTRLELNYRQDLFTRTGAEEVLGRFRHLLRTVVAGMDTPVGRIGLLTPAELERTLTEWNDTTRGHPVTTLPALFEDRARRDPAATAVVCGTTRLTFAEVNARANRVARRLAAHGAGPDDLVALALPRTADSVVAILGILKSGAAYVPVDLEYPAERISTLFEEARPRLVLTDAASARNLPDGGPARLLVEEALTDGPGAHEADLTDTERVRPLLPSHLAYVIYTSGSTGRPKGVAVEHRALANMFHSHRAHFFTPETEAAGGGPLRVALTNALVFDASWSQLLWMVAGHELHLVDEDTRKDPQALVAYVAHHRVDVLDTTPGFFRQLRSAGLLDGEGHRPRTLALGGEAVGDTLWAELRATPGLSVYNLYGPAECTVDAMLCRVGDATAPTIGRPADNIRLYLLDERMRPVPVGVEGELYLAGAGLARGYLGRSGLTAERFIADPFGTPGARMYRTGDLGRRLPDGTVAFAGRSDDQVKVRGFRIEPGEIESVLAADATVDQASVVVREDRPGVRRLVAYVVPVAGENVDAVALRALTAAVLPDHMVPAAVVALPALPLTHNGKLDRAALPAPEFAAATTSRPPRTERERALCDLYADALGAENVGIDDSFFDLGGDSITSMQLAARARESGLLITPKDVFTHRTVAALAEAARELSSDTAVPAPSYDGPLFTPDRDERAELDRLCPGLADVLPLTPLQEGMHFHAVLAEDGIDVYNTQRPLELTGELAPAVLRAACAALLDRHPNLRAGFVRLRSGRLVQAVSESVTLPWQEVDLSALAAGEQRARVTALMAEDRIRPFDLTRPPLVRVTLVRLAADRHLMLLTHHHIVLDGWSLPLFFRDLFAMYARGGDGSALPPAAPYRDYLGWLGDQDREATERAWREVMAGLDEPTLVAPGADAAAARIPELVSHRLDEAAGAALTTRARSLGLTLNTVIQGAWAVVLGRHTSRHDVVFGATVAGRPAELPGSADIVGMLMNTNAVRVRLNPARPLAAELQHLQRTRSALSGHQHVPLADVQRWCGLGELFDTVVGFENTPVDRDSVREQVPGLRITLDEEAAPGATHYPLSLVVVPGERPSLELNYRGDLFDRDTAQALLDRLRRVLDVFVTAPSTPVGGIDLLGPDERARILTEWNDTGRELPAATIPDLFAEQVRRAPEALAVESGERTLTYAQLDDHANRLARVLVSHGVGPEARVAIAVPRSAESVVATLAVLKAGAAYLPVDTSYPPDRVAYMLDDSRPVLVLATRETAPGLPVAPDRLLLVDAPDLWTAAPGGDLTDADRTGPLRPASAAYVIYTSGSTGRPKGVVVTHAGVASMVATQADRIGAGPGGRVLLFASPSFDASVWELCTALLTGSCAVTVPAERLLPGPELARTVAEHEVSCLLLPPSSLAAMPEDGLPPGVTLVVGGEACAPDLVARWSTGRVMVNAYGPTEATVMATMSDPLHGHRSPPMGAPVVNARVYLLDDGLQPVPVGVPGELCVAGAGLARGYLGRPALTAERFVADPFGAPGTRMYRTGDVARWRADGSLEYLGRVDHQVKVRGFRIELGEIESVLAADDTVGQVVVHVREDGHAVKRIVAYLVAATDAVPDLARLRERAAAALPDYMVPAAFVVLDALPVTPGGKLDRAALPEPEFSSRAESRAPRSAVEKSLCDLFAEVLPVESVGIDDSFFDLGGDSIISVQLVTRARKIGLGLSPRHVFTHKTVAELAAIVTDLPDAEPPGTVPAGAMTSEDPLVVLDQDELDEFAADWGDSR
ncbi:non-ribosomal peptide synthetase [Streptomyces sp. NBC_00343]|uniref:non-ribosomal peptide synthetase n=1 Tax=Streptomyces sp. NBC_00343 TaxID=2975719 RepID=UPI002E2E2341|nr:non-ribosomal peptide synthetase [Streptomyces sp. NBC_00343]